MRIIVKKGDKVLNLEAVMFNKSTARKSPYEVIFYHGERIKTNIKPIVRKGK